MALPAGADGRRPRGGRRPSARPGTVRRDGDVAEISAEKGYLREFGNIVFHFSLLGLLVAIAVGKLFGYEGNVIVIANGVRAGRTRQLPTLTASPADPARLEGATA